jgi:hypothetical protein
MNDPIKVKFVDVGIVNGFRTIEVYNADTEEKIGFNQFIEENLNSTNQEEVE